MYAVPINYLPGDYEGRAFPDNRYTLSWATGEHYSQWARLREYMRRNGDPAVLERANFATVGAKIENLAPQVQQLLTHLEARKNLPLRYITVALGINNLARIAPDSPEVPSDQEVTETFLRALRPLGRLRQNEPVHLVVVPVPNLADVGKPEVARARVVLWVSCARFRRHHQFLQNWATWVGDGYNRNTERIRSFNLAMEKAVSILQREFPNSLKTHFASYVFDDGIVVKLLSLDGCHPGPHGHQSLSAAVWRNKPWFH
jgi:lysophospholipase L1-like esterase